MAELTLTQLFGSGATQDASTLTIQKSALVAQGLTASSSNTAESLVVALVKQWQSVATPTAQESNGDIQVTIEDSYQSIVTRNNTQYREFSKTIKLQIEDTTSTIDPDDF
ncbi:hypothetical protein [Calothrix sp. NIES-2098]|uniref:hypothetical protein n=1 Tax=Calothrix sp. NIES-2098 TaxID=1954171 RepID=UPI000B5EC1FD|nr:hypothetical protein NIES2098_38150 [Calothrix sp. NIES-2098]